MVVLILHFTHETKYHIIAFRNPTLCGYMQMPSNCWWINYLLFPWEPMQILKYHGNQNYCRPISSLLLGKPMTQSYSFLDQLSFKVRISNFPWQQIKMFKFWFLYYTPWPWQIDCAKFCWDRPRNGGGDIRNSRICTFSCKNEDFFDLHGNDLQISQFR